MKRLPGVVNQGTPQHFSYIFPFCSCDRKTDVPSNFNHGTSYMVPGHA